MTNYYVSSIPLMLIGLTGLATAKIPDGVEPLTFYGVSALVALTILAIIGWVVQATERQQVIAAYTFGCFLLLLLLGNALAILVTLEPYVPPQ